MDRGKLQRDMCLVPMTGAVSAATTSTTLAGLNATGVTSQEASDLPLTLHPFFPIYPFFLTTTTIFNETVPLFSPLFLCPYPQLL